MNYGASQEAWAAWRQLAADDLLPSVANPNAPIAFDSKLTSAGKVPCRYNQQGEVVGIGKWTSYMPSPNELDRWSSEPDYAISVQTRGSIKAIDVDVDDPRKSKIIRQAIVDMLGPCPVRFRDNSGKLLIVVRHADPMPKAVLKVEGGIIEILGDGQQFIAEGQHTSGERYRWNSAPLEAMPEVDGDTLVALRDRLEMCFGLEPWKIAREKRDGQGNVGAASDEVAAWLCENWEVYEDTGQQLHILCPFADGHSTSTGPSSTSYFPAGTGGYAQGHFVCLHGSCNGRDDRQFLDAVGYSASQFADLVTTDPVDVGDASGGDIVPAGIDRDSKGGIFATAKNLTALCAHPRAIGKWLAFDSFKDEIVWAPAHQPFDDAQWRAFSDIDYTDVRIALETRGCKPMSKDMLRDAVKHAAMAREMDTAQVWLSRQQWDGVERIDSFCVAGWGWTSSPYSRAVGRYIWTALAGRVIEPGCQADMAPILVGLQGVGKTSAIRAMAPAEEHYVSIPLDDHDNDTSRRLRGKLVAELEELRGLNSRGIEAIKAWITRRTEGWIPKYMEFEATFKRRCIFIGSTNEEEFLADPSGERRWLPGRCGEVDIEWIKEHREQLWAEGAAKFMLGGVDWQEAQELAVVEHHDFKVSDSWEPAVARWLIEPRIDGTTPTEIGHVTLGDALAGAVAIPMAQHDRAKEMRMARVLRGMGWDRRRLPVQEDGSRPWAYVKGE